jgi:uncharacterized membrane protein
MNIVTRLYRAWSKTQTPVILPISLIVVGTVSLILGEGASKSFSNLGGATVIRIMGVFMVVGGVLIVSSILKSNYAREVLGLSLSALGAAIYGGGVILGLHAQGLVAGIGYTGITLTLLGRIFFLLQEARRREQLDRAP